METVVVESKALSTVAEREGLPAERAKPLLVAFQPFFAAAQAAVEASALIVVTDPTQVSEIKQARDARLGLRKIRVEVENTRKAMKEDSLRAGKAIDGMANVLKYLIEPAESRLEEMEKIAERMEAERKAALKAEREKMLAPFVSDLSGYNLADMKPDDFVSLLAGVKHAAEARAEAARKAEAERIAAEAARIADEKRIRDENERLRAEAVEREKAARLEREKMEAAAAAERAKARAVQEQAEAAARAEKAEAEKKIAAERAAREKLEREAAERKRAEEKAAAEEAERQRRAASAPDREKLAAIANAVRALHVPAMSNPCANVVAGEVRSKIEAFARWIESKAETL